MFLCFLQCSSLYPSCSVLFSQEPLTASLFMLHPKLSPCSRAQNLTVILLLQHEAQIREVEKGKSYLPCPLYTDALGRWVLESSLFASLNDWKLHAVHKGTLGYHLSSTVITYSKPKVFSVKNYYESRITSNGRKEHWCHISDAGSIPTVIISLQLTQTNTAIQFSLAKSCGAQLWNLTTGPMIFH